MNHPSGDTSRVSIIGICAPRTGSTSLTDFIANVYALNGIDREVRHDSDRNLAPAILDYVSKGKESKLAQCLTGWTHDAEITTYSLGFVLEGVLRILSDDVKFIVLKRDKEKTVESICRRIESHPNGYDGYKDDPAENVPGLLRPCAPHYGEMSWDEWYALDRHAKVSWYYDRQYAFAEMALANASAESMTVWIDDLNGYQTRKELAQFILGASDIKVPETSVKHLMSGFSFLPPNVYRRIDDMLGEFDWHSMENDGTSLIRHLFAYHLRNNEGIEAMHAIQDAMGVVDAENAPQSPPDQDSKI